MDIREATNQAVLPYHETSYAELEKITRSSYLKITWWGSRRVYSTDPHYTGYIPLYELLDRVIWLVRQNIEFDMTERQYGAATYKKIETMMDKEKDYEKECSLITRIFQAIIYTFTHLDVKYYTSAPSYIWYGGHEYARFNKFTKDQYRAAFSIEPTEEGCYSNDWLPNEPMYWTKVGFKNTPVLDTE